MRDSTRLFVGALQFLRYLFVGASLSFVAFATEIIGVTWDPAMHVIHIELDRWPRVWPGWRMYLDGVEIPMESGPGKPVIRPDAPLSQPPTGLLIGTLPWVSGLDHVDFPCCGTIQLHIPGEGLTNSFHFNLHDLGCKTASPRDCPSEWTVHEGDLIVGGGEIRLIEGKKFSQKGNVRIHTGATLIIRDTEFMMARGAVPTVHVYFFVDPGGKLIIENSRIYSPSGGTASGLICVMNRGEVRLIHSPTKIHYFDMSDGARFTMERSEMVNPIGGLLQVTGGETHVVDSTIGALALRVPASARLEARRLHSGVYFEHWDVRELIKGVDYQLVLERTTLLKDELSGELKHGPYERGWIFFLDPAAHVRLSDSELRKVFLDINNDNVEFRNLRVGTPSNLTYRDIKLENVVVMGQWPFHIWNSRVTIYDSDYLFLQPSGFSTVKLVRSHMVEFIPRDFFGTMICEDATWTTAGEIIGGVPYHSNANRFTIKGSLRLESLRESLQWKNAQVTREFEVEVTDAAGRPVKGAMVLVGSQTYLTDPQGRAKFLLVFNEANYNRPTALEVRLGDRLLGKKKVDFFTESPIRIQGATSKVTAPSGIPEVAVKSRFGYMTEHADWAVIEKSRNRWDYLKWERAHPGFANWQEIEPKKGEYHWEKIDRYVKTAQERGIQILFAIWPFTDWDQITCNLHLPWQPNDWGKDPRDFLSLAHRKGKPCDMEACKEFLRQLVERYDGDGMGDMPGLRYPVRYWEIGNEPDGAHDRRLRGLFFQGSVEDYFEILKVSYTTIKEADPNAVVLIAALPSLPWRVYEKGLPKWARPDFDALKLFELGAAKYFDIMNVHEFGSSKKVREILARYGADDKPIWITEPGGFRTFREDVGAKTEDELVEALVRLFIEEFENGVERIFLGGPEYLDQALYKAVLITEGKD
ncbi:hypothetical protein H5T53_04815 [Candidatus Bipolaricaulota bacterium]|nr:hypothetical protein [Candidatus Bipolaricaulota bacterium]